MPSETTLERALLVALALTLAAGCKPKIGDDCSVSTDCSSTGDRLCDTTQPGGYCTIFNCEPGTCPEEAYCVAFLTAPSLVCEDPQDPDRLQRTFCMRRCDNDGDCRGGYDCVNLNNPDNPWGAKVVEFGSVNGKMCIAPYTGLPAPEDSNTEVCTGTDAGFDVVPWEPDTGAPTDAGTDAASDAADAVFDALADASDASDQ
jgi:hypothetical protein